MSAALPHQPAGGASRHGRVADALIATYLRELVADDELDPPAGPDPHAELGGATAPAPDGLAGDGAI
jgi:hypothetical protein